MSFQSSPIRVAVPGSEAGYLALSRSLALSLSHAVRRAKSNRELRCYSPGRCRRRAHRKRDGGPKPGWTDGWMDGWMDGRRGGDHDNDNDGRECNNLLLCFALLCSTQLCPVICGRMCCFFIASLRFASLSLLPASVACFASILSIFFLSIAGGSFVVFPTRERKKERICRVTVTSHSMNKCRTKSFKSH